MSSIDHHLTEYVAVPEPDRRSGGFDVLTTACILEDQLGKLERKCEDSLVEFEEKRQRASVLGAELQMLIAQACCEREITNSMKRTWAPMDEEHTEDIFFSDLDTIQIVLAHENDADPPSTVHSPPSFYNEEELPSFSEPLDITSPVSTFECSPTKLEDRATSNRRVEPREDAFSVKSGGSSFISDLPKPRAPAAFAEGPRPWKEPLGLTTRATINVDAQRDGTTSDILSRGVSKRMRLRRDKGSSEGAAMILDEINHKLDRGMRTCTD